MDQWADMPALQSMAAHIQARSAVDLGKLAGKIVTAGAVVDMLDYDGELPNELPGCDAALALLVREDMVDGLMALAMARALTGRMARVFLRRDDAAAWATSQAERATGVSAVASSAPARRPRFAALRPAGRKGQLSLLRRR